MENRPYFGKAIDVDRGQFDEKKVFCSGFTCRRDDVMRRFYGIGGRGVHRI